MVLTVLPSMQSSFSDNEKRSAEILANGSRTFNVGIVDYTGSVSTLNPFVYTTSAEYETIYPSYSKLLTYDINAKIIGDLATSWSLSPDGLTWNFKLAQNAYFVDPAAPNSTAHQVTAKDVMWTFWEVNNDTGNHLSRYLNVGGVGIIDRMWTGTNPWDLYLSTKSTYAPFIGALTTIPIVPEYIWGHFTGSVTPRNYRNLPPIGSGAFYCTVNSVPVSGPAILKRNPQWFQETNRGWQLHIDTLQLKNEMNPDSAWAHLTSTPPLIDVYLNVAPSLYLNPPGGQPPGILRWAQSGGFVYEYQLNQLDQARRTQYENAGLMNRGGTSNPLLLDPIVKLAMAMCVDKQAFVDQALLGLGTVADSLVPDCNPWHYTYPNPVQYNPTAARALLMAAGWAYDSTGAPATSTTVPLYKAGGTSGLDFRLMTLNQNTEWLVGSNLLSQSAALAGVKLNLWVVSMNQMLSTWYAGDYDTYLWNWVFTPTSDPSTDCLSVDTTMAIGSWSSSYWHNASYDSLYNRSLTEMDPVARRQLTDQMQASIYEDHNDQLVAYTKNLYAASTYNWYGPSYGDWAAHWTLTPDQAYPWLYMQLSPVDNHAPTVAVGQSNFLGYMGVPISFFGSAIDDHSPLMYQWYWGDGTSSGWQTSASLSHTYVAGGLYHAYLAAQEQGTADGFISWNDTTATVIGDDHAPTISSIWMRPSTGLEQWTVVRFVANATDLDGDPLYYNWDFGDGYTGTGRDANHTFSTGGSYIVTVRVDDGHIGPGRPAIATRAVSVKINHPPVISIQSSQTVNWKTNAPFTATASDADLDTMRFTWVWDDGSKLVTTTPSATHWYTQKGIFNVRVYADDLTGLPGHNVSALDVVRVLDLGTTAPFGLTLSVNKTSVFVGQSVTFTATAQDPVGDGMRFTVACGDGTFVNVDTPATGNNAVVTVTASHTYLSAGVMTARLYVSDGLDNITLGTPVTVTVTLNSPPVVAPLTNKTAWAGSSTSFSAIAVDPDGDPMRYTWDFGDGTPLQAGPTTTHIYAKAGMYAFTVYVDDLKGIPGHNVSSSATAQIAFNLALAVGWNFVSVPLIGGGYKASTIGLATGDMISSWNSTTQSYDHTYIKGISPPSANFTIAPSTGYWIWVAVAKTLHLYGSVPTTIQVKVCTVPTSGGWIAVGFLGVNTVYHASDIPKMYSGTGAIMMVAYYNAATGKYSSWLSAVPALNNFLLAPGQGYLCWITAGPGGTLSYMPR
jgi:ABC-type transport system substrate-binding protein